MMDKFFNFLLRAREVADELGGHRDLWERIYFQYWMNDIIRLRRHQLWIYFTKFYEGNAASLPITLAPGDLEEFEKECAKRNQPKDE